MTRNTRREFYGVVSTFFIDVAKLTFAGVILAGILKEDISILWLLMGGTMTTCFCLFAGYHYFVRSKKS